MNNVLNSKFKKTIALAVLSLLVIAVIVAYSKDVLDKGQNSIQSEPTSYVTKSLVRIGDVLLKVDIVDTPALREQGLSGRETLPELEGMLFVFEEPGAYPFWMKEMNFPIDIIWIGDDFRVVDVTHSASEDSFPQTFSPKVPARYVLEVNAGFSREYGVGVGDTVQLTL